MEQQVADPDDKAALAAAGVCETRKLYLRPELVRLGTLADITRTVGRNGARDGGNATPRSRTSQ